MSCTYMSQTIEQNEIKFVIVVDFQENPLTATHLMMTKNSCKTFNHFFIL